MTSIWWIRRDLRLTDNPTLHAALEAGSVIPVFILDPAFAAASPRRKSFLYAGLSSLHKNLQARNSYLVVRTGKPLDALRRLMKETGAHQIFAEEDYTPYARKRDGQIAKALPLKLIPGQTVHHPEFVKKADGSPYTVYTPYSRKWKELLPTHLNLYPAPQDFPEVQYPHSNEIPELPDSKYFPAGEAEALKRLDLFINSSIFQYADSRNRMDLEGTSSLSPYIRFGMLGLRQAVSAARQARVEAGSEEQKHSAEIWLNELIWREFYIQILYHFPRVAKMSFNPSLANIPWRNNKSEFDAWKEGRTGVPIVDAAMRQLQQTGWMHNRARMIVASYLVKDLLIDWRWGEAWFMENLLDGDIASNNGGWQWTAGTGTDAAPYFRIFNPVLQSAKFDPNGDYIRKWVSELKAVSAKEIHAPWEFGIKIEGYPKQPIVERNKERTLRAYQESKNHS
jgi:deoxyribodipyrimidine photo-lyase